MEGYLGAPADGTRSELGWIGKDRVLIGHSPVSVLFTGQTVVPTIHKDGEQEMRFRLREKEWEFHIRGIGLGAMHKRLWVTFLDMPSIWAGSKSWALR